MRRPSARALAAGVLATALLVALALLGTPEGARSSVLSRDAEGWAAMRGYLAARGTDVVLLDRPLGRAAPGAGTLVLSFPWQHAAWTGDVPAAVAAHLRRGGHLLVAYSGSETALAEDLLLESLGLPLAPARPAPPLGPVAWRRHAREVWRLPPPAGGGRALVLPAPDVVPRAPDGAEILFRSPADAPVAFHWVQGRSRLAAVPAAALASARLALPGNADLLETLRTRLPAPWIFDEFHHGLAAPGGGAETAAQSRVLDLVLLQVIVLYLLFVASSARRFGPAWKDAAVSMGSTAGFFLGLGALHHRLGHHAEAARRLVDRSRALDPDLAIPADVERRAAGGVDAAGLVAVAQAVARARSTRRPDA